MHFDTIPVLLLKSNISRIPSSFIAQAIFFPEGENFNWPTEFPKFPLLLTECKEPIDERTGVVSNPEFFNK